MALRFDWPDLWDYHHSIEDPEIKAHLEDEVVGDGWLFHRSAKEQARVLSGAPEEFVKRIAKKLKPEVQINLGFNPYA